MILIKCSTFEVVLRFFRDKAVTLAITCAFVQAHVMASV